MRAFNRRKNRRRVTPTSDEKEEMKKPSPLTCFLLGIVLSVALHCLLPLQRVIAFPWRLAGLVPLLAGIVLNLLADQALKQHGTTVKPFEKSSAFVTDGVFRISRNPMYLGMTLVLLGIALLLGSLTPLAVVILVPILFDRVFISPEEKMLEQTFGDPFREYRKRVRKWI
ncbi:MAG: isoprenylcysteine carboxylmethyltransferase family protein [Deltaproteobacteria bacterium]|nr:isoprenylcysteine carboxylmethyltransferase family protein [Deltaproteobacteria bacterium]